MNYFRLGWQLALAFFIAATGLLIAFYFTPSTKTAVIAYQFTIVAIITHWLYAAVLLLVFLKRLITLNQLVKTLGVMALNVPVGIAYSYLMVFLLSYARITFLNTTGAEIPVLTIHGCEQREIRELENGKSETVWIKIPGECSISISYKVDGLVKKEPVLSALKKEGGVKIRYEIGSTK